MKIKDARIRTKLIGGFFAVVFIFAVAASHQLISQISLRSLQKEAAVSTNNAVAVKEVNQNLSASSAIITEAIVNRNLEKAAQQFAEFKQSANRDISAILAIAGSDQEKRSAEEFSQHYKKYIDIFEKSFLPLLSQRQDVVALGEGVIVLNSIERETANIHLLAIELIVNNDMALWQAEYPRLKQSLEPLLAAAGKAAVTVEQKAKITYITGGLRQFTDALENRFVPMLKSKERSADTIRSIYDDLDISRARTLATIQTATQMIQDNLNRSKENESRLKQFTEDLDAECAACMKPLNAITQSIMDKNAGVALNHERVASMAISTTIGICIIDLIGALIIASFIIRLITGPVAKAVGVAQAVALGDLTASIDVQQRDEMGALADALNRMVHNLSGLVQVAQRIAMGDLTVGVQPLSDRDGLGHALKDMVGRLSGIIAEINLSANNVAEGAAQMNATSQAMSQGATEQASSLEEISSSMNEIAAQTRLNAENATQANRLAGEAKALAERGNDRMGLMVEAMKGINESGRNISRIIKVIDEIAFQTNLLALNAAVEAARAGRHGKGFAVVAEEVRSLAARSAKAARETAELIEGSVKKVGDGTQMADKTAEALNEIVAATGKVTDLVGEIAAASNEQAQGIGQITQGLGHVDQVTQQNTAHAEQSAASAQELSSQSMLLQQLVSSFKLEENTAPRAVAPQS
jgi:methyl-accepting chemotaxis protein